MNPPSTFIIAICIYLYDMNVSTDAIWYDLFLAKSLCNDCFQSLAKAVYLGLCLWYIGNFIANVNEVRQQRQLDSSRKRFWWLEIPIVCQKGIMCLSLVYSSL